MEESRETLAWLQGIIDRSYEAAGPAIKRNFGGDWTMSAEEFAAFWAEDRMASVSTVSAEGDVHVAPLDPTFRAGRFYILTSGDS
jgi:hypothetical protein